MSYSSYISINIAITTQSIRGHQRSYSGQKTPELAHDQHQLCAVIDGALAVRDPSGAWTVPAGSAAWIPARTRYAIEPRPRATARTLYLPVRPRRAADGIAVLSLTPLARAVIDHVCDTPPRAGAAARRLLGVLMDQVPLFTELPLFVPSPASALAQSAAEALLADPGGTARIRDLAAAFGVGGRTLERAFTAGAGMTLGEWRQRSRVCRAVELLAGGMAVKDVALEVGYETPSAFVAAFKRYAGATPAKIMKNK